MISIRFFLYTFIWIAYIAFLTSYAPLGSDWLDWHAQRVSNAVKFLELNGYFSSYGFTIWTDCIDCNLDASFWKDKIYFSTNGFSLLPYIVINYFFDSEGLLNYAHITDKITIFFTGVLLSELSLKFLNYSKIPKFIISSIIFTLFSVNPWTYKMIIAGWTEIYFVLIFLIGIFIGINSYYKTSIALFFISGLFNFVWAIALAFFYLLISQIPRIIKDTSIDIENFFPSYSNNTRGLEYFFAFLGSVIFIFFLRFLANINLINSSGTSLLERIGISGIDIHNGGIIGALQFLGGNRLTQCFFSYEESKITSDLNLGIEAYNCILSISSMFLLSLASIIGIFFMTIKFVQFKKILAPLCFSLMLLLFVFQQSFSVHLMGYSYIFSILFSIGLSYYFLSFLSNGQVISLRYIFSIPLFAGILILCVRVSMLTGING